jgi:hypothetical protein
MQPKSNHVVTSWKTKKITEVLTHPRKMIIIYTKERPPTRCGLAPFELVLPYPRPAKVQG